ncbi:MAG: HNH endonuclease [Dehalococcoidia bacterium]
MAKTSNRLPRWAQVIVIAFILGAIIWALVPTHIIWVAIAIALIIIALLSYLAYKRQGPAAFTTFAKKAYYWLSASGNPSQHTTFPKAPDLTSSERALFIHYTGNRCEDPTCGKTGNLEIHHIKPRHEGGTNTVWNLLVLCPNHHDSANKGIPPRQRQKLWVQEHRTQRIRLLRSGRWDYR